jgi:hypothetical protein
MVTEKDGNKTLEPNPETAPIAKKIFEMAYNEYSYTDIIYELEKNYIPPPKGKYWQKSTLYEILHNPIYIGTKAFNRRKGNIRQEKGNWILTENAFPPIIDKEIFYKIQTESSFRSKPRKDNDALLSGLLFCSVCGSKKWYRGIYKKGRKYGTYICSKRINNGGCKTPSISASLVADYIF